LDNQLEDAMSLILVNTPYSFVDWDGSRRSYFDFSRRQNSSESLSTLPGEHLGLMSIKSYCEAKGLPVAVVNGMLENFTTPEETFAAVVRTARRSGPPALLGFSGTNFVFRDSLEIIRLARERWPDAKVVMGYDFATLNYQKILFEYPQVDFICRGEGERVFAQLASKIGLGNASYGEIRGLAYRAPDGRPVATDPDPIDDLDSLPWASRDHVAKTMQMGLAVGVFGTRGCPYRCSYCTTGQTAALFNQKSYRERSVKNLVDEMEYLVKDHKVSHISVVDDLFVTKGQPSQERAAAFAREILARNLKISFMIDCRVDSINRSLFALLYKAGLRRVFIGIETGSPEQLAAYNKRYLLNSDSPLSRLQILLDLGIGIIPGLIPFHPKVTTAELRATLNIIEAIGYDGSYLVNKVKAYPGTPLYREFEAAGHLTRGEWPVKDWDFAEDRMYDFVKHLDFLGSRPDCRQEDVLAEFHRQLDEWDAELTEAA
jgi:radical SAM superfamily enzyme YgiQ (UPF0313 family)